MSRTKRKHWLREEMRDGVKRPHIKTHKVKAPPLIEEEVDLSSELYVFDEMWDLDEGFYCENCGQWLTKFEYYAGDCEC